jgi:hypothetical protein
VKIEESEVREVRSEGRGGRVGESERGRDSNVSGPERYAICKAR